MADDTPEEKMWSHGWREQGEVGCPSEEQGVRQAGQDGKVGSILQCSGLAEVEERDLHLPPSH